MSVCILPVSWDVNSAQWLCIVTVLTQTEDSLHFDADGFPEDAVDAGSFLTFIRVTRLTLFQQCQEC